MPSKAKQTTTAEKADPAKSAALKKASPAAGASAKDASAGKGASGKKVNPALMKPLQPSKELAAVVGSKPLPRAEVVSKVWDYIPLDLGPGLKVGQSRQEPLHRGQ